MMANNIRILTRYLIRRSGPYALAALVAPVFVFLLLSILDLAAYSISEIWSTSFRYVSYRINLGDAFNLRSISEPLITMIYSAVTLGTMLIVIIFGSARHFVGALVLAAMFLLAAMIQTYVPREWQYWQPLFIALDMSGFAAFFVMSFSFRTPDAKNTSRFFRRNLLHTRIILVARWSLFIAALQALQVFAHLTRDVFQVPIAQYYLALNALFLASVLALVISATPKSWANTKHLVRIKLIYLFVDLAPRIIWLFRKVGDFVKGLIKQPAANEHLSFD